MQKSIFHEEWWLDSLAPGGWREVACYRGERIAGYLRYVERREGGMSICEMPQITRFLGPVVTVPSGKAEARFRSAYSTISDLLEQLAAYDHVEMTLNTEFRDLTPFLAAGYEVRVHPTFLLDCRQPIEELWAGLRDKNIAHLGAVSLLLWTGIEFAHARELCFDFDGGITDDARYKFKVAFGGKLANRFDVARSTARYQLQRTIRKIPRAIARRISARA